LIAAKTADRNRKEEDHGIQRALRRCEPAEEHEGFTLEECPGECDRINPIAVPSDQISQVHPRQSPPL
jgi:hypothetical protein